MIKPLFASMLLVGQVHASPLGQSWSEFEHRCLTPFESFKSAQLDGLVEIGSVVDGYRLPKGAILLVNWAETGTRSCTVEGAGLAKGFETWRAQAVKSGRYIEIEPGIWHSHEWIEPVIAVLRDDRSVTVVETDLES